MSRAVTILAGGIGGSKLVDGLARVEPSVQLTVIGNTGDDIVQHGLWISPDVDIVTYTLAGRVDQEKGWGFADETFHALEGLNRLGCETWMNLGDRDLATHIFRTLRRSEGVRPTEIAGEIARRLGVKARILLPSDDPVQTIIDTPIGPLNFQEFFVREQCKPEIQAVRFDGVAEARPTPEALEAIAAADLLVIAPSNPIGSIGPILAVPGIREAIQETSARRVAVSAIVGGQSLKGPSDRMMKAMGFTADATGIADCYAGLIDALVIDQVDAALEGIIRKKSLQVLVTNTVMKNQEDREGLAEGVLGFMG